MADKSELDLIQDSYLKTWQIFVAWFSWFVNINLLALGWLLTSTVVKPMGPFVLMMEFLVLTGIGATICIFNYSRKCHARAQVVAPPSFKNSLEEIIPSPITNYASIAMFLALLAVGTMWWGMWKFN